ncbi:hypothetical protein FRB94_008023 [Tulasnella sp. JGI-2019a]|nr:hypothetical protein FRB94_008023 [Tulasnella sp. JGI-2019a]KAG9022321.1 hypothetical protein FRB95_000351 [Tulasnella sp. JGI-2019a]
MIRLEPLGKAVDLTYDKHPLAESIRKQSRCSRLLLIRVFVQHEIIKNGRTGLGLSPGFTGGHAASLGLL